MANDIIVAVSGNPIKNGTVVASCTFTGEYATNTYYVKNTPDINTIDDKYDNRFYNGIFVSVVGSGV